MITSYSEPGPGFIRKRPSTGPCNTALGPANRCRGKAARIIVAVLATWAAFLTPTRVLLAAEPILVFAAASTTDAIKAIGTLYRKRAHLSVDFSFGSSSALARQIIAGAPADVFLSADMDKMRWLEEAGLVKADDVQPLLSNRLVVVEPRSSHVDLSSPQDLTALSSLALADPQAVPAGIYARQWLERRKLWQAIAPLVIPARDVRSALAMVEAEAVQAGIVYRTDALIARNARAVYEVPADAHPPIVYPIAVIATSHHREAARAFVQFLKGEQAKEVFSRYGFITLASG